MPTKSLFIADLVPGEPIDSIFALSKKQLMTTKNGDPYLSIELSDRTGSVQGKVWSNGSSNDHWCELTERSIVHIIGTTQTYMGKKQLVVTAIEAYNEPYFVGDFIATINEDLDQLEKSLFTIIDSITSSHLKTLLQHFFQNPVMLEKFKHAPAAKKVHDNKIGGLMKHTLQLVKMIELLLPLYKNLNLDRDLLISATLLHDIGKTTELDWSGGCIGYSDDGRFIGHINLSIMWVSEKISQITGFPDDIRKHLLHCIISHHGELEFGANVLPATKEAFFLHGVDKLDSSLVGVDQLSENGGGWTYSNQWNRWIFTPDAEESPAEQMELLTE